MALRSWLGTASFAALLLAACSLGNDLDDLQRQEQAGAAGADAGGNGGAAGAGQGGAGAGQGDAGASQGGAGAGQGGAAGSSAGGQGGAGQGGGGAGGLGNCASGVGVFCDGFEGEVLGAGWTDPEDFANSASLTVGPHEPGNGTPRALRFTAAKSDSETPRQYRFVQRFDAPRFLRCAVDLRIDQPVADTARLLSVAIAQPNGDEFSATYVADSSEARFETFSPQFNEPDHLDAPPIGVWFRVEIEASADGDARLFLDGAASAIEPMELGGALAYELRLGIVSIGISNQAAFDFDNLACDFR
jgi:hypothetical protein